MNDFSLSYGLSVPGAGFGTWKLPSQSASEVVTNAITSGYRHIDCASIYGNEAAVGQGIAEAIKAGLVERSDLFVTSKLWNTDHDPADVEAACRKTLADLGLEYLDLYLVHWGVSFEHGGDLEPLDENGIAKFAFVPLQGTWQAMENLVEKGLVKSIGVANYTATMLLDLLSYAKVKPVMNQIELHPYLTQQTLVDFCHAQNIVVTAYSPLGSNGTPVLEDPVITQLAADLGRKPAQIVLRWALQRGTIAIPKSENAARIAENFAIFDFELSEAAMKTITALDKKIHLVDPINWWGFPYF